MAPPINFDVTEHHGDRTLHLRGTGVLVGELIRGASRVERGKRVTEWAFENADGDLDEAHTTISGAFDDARAFVLERYAHLLPGGGTAPTGA